MRRHHIAFIILVLFTLAWSLWSLREVAQLSQPPAPPRIAELLASNATLAGDGVRHQGEGDSYTFEHEGRTVTVDLEQVRRSHAMLVRQTPDKDPTGALDPDFHFLSWPKRTFLGVETIKTRKCWVIDFRNPARSPRIGPHYVVRLYVDQELGALMRTQSYDWSGKLVLGYSTTAGKLVNGVLAVKSAEASYYEPGSRRVVQRIAYERRPESQ